MRCRATSAALVALLLCGCGSSARRARPTYRAAAADACEKTIVTGHGTVGVVLLPQSNGDACQWSNFARVLEARGMRVARVSWQRGYLSDALRAIRALRAAGARRVALMGASLGGHISLIAAARHPAGVSAVVTLSAERTERSDRRDAARAARRIRIPALTIGSRNDGWTTFGAETRAIHRALAARVNVLRMIAGDAHGVDLLAGPRGARLTAEIVRFLRREA